MSRNPSTVDPMSMDGSITTGTGNSQQHSTAASNQETPSNSSSSEATPSLATSSQYGHSQQPPFSAPTTNSIPFAQHQGFHPTLALTQGHGIPETVNLSHQAPVNLSHQTRQTQPFLQPPPPLTQPSRSTTSSHFSTSSVTSEFLLPQFPQDWISTLANELQNTNARVVAMEQRMAMNHHQLLQAINQLVNNNVHQQPITHPSMPTAHASGPSTQPTQTSGPPNMYQPSAQQVTSTAIPHPTAIPSPHSPHTAIGSSPYHSLPHHSSMKLKLETLNAQARSMVRRYEAWRASTIRKIAINHNTKSAVNLTMNLSRTSRPTSNCSSMTHSLLCYNLIRRHCSYPNHSRRQMTYTPSSHV